MKRKGIAALLVAATFVFASFCLVVIDEREQAFRTLLDQSRPVLLGASLNTPVIDRPGIYVRIPGLHQLYRFDRRLQRFDAEPRELYTADKLKLEVDYYVVWRVEDPEEFFKSLRTVDRAQRRIDSITYGELREELARRSFEDLLSARREEILHSILKRSEDSLSRMGIAVHDVRIRRTDYPEVTLARIYERMRTERQRYAMKYRAEGEEQARAIRSKADEESVVIRAEAQRVSATMYGEGDAESARIFGEAHTQDPEFYAFVRSLDAYRRALNEQTTLVLSSESSFLDVLFGGASSSGGSGSKAPARAVTTP